jgi:hypothetical protein
MHIVRQTKHKLSIVASNVVLEGYRRNSIRRDFLASSLRTSSTAMPISRTRNAENGKTVLPFSAFLVRDKTYRFSHFSLNTECEKRVFFVFRDTEFREENELTYTRAAPPMTQGASFPPRFRRPCFLPFPPFPSLPLPYPPFPFPFPF